MTAEPSTPCRIEIVGVAGSGKSTLTRAIRERDAGWRLPDALHTRAPAHWTYVAHGVPSVLPLLAASARRGPALSWDELKFAIYVSEWTRFLRARHAAAPTVLDQGPLFALARLLWSGKPVTQAPAFRRWLEAMVVRWSLELGLVVCLVAPDDVLLARINGRGQAHEVKGAARGAGLAVLESHRRAYAELLERLHRLGRPRVLSLDTRARSPAELAGEVVEAVEAGP
jgi:thymidylate kinase